MEEVLRNVTSLSWWIGVVIVGIIINLIAIYSKPLFDKLLARISRVYKTRSEAREECWRTRRDQLTSEKHEQLLQATTVNRLILIGILLLLLSGGIFILGLIAGTFSTVMSGVPAVKAVSYRVLYTFTIICSGLGTIIAMSYFFRAIYEHGLLREALKEAEKVRANKSSKAP